MAKKSGNGQAMKLIISILMLVAIGAVGIIYTNLSDALETKSDKAVCDTRYEHMEEHHREAKAERKQILELIREIKGDR